jgi:hypothetical protein
MEEKNENYDLVEKARQHELALAELYGLYAQKLEYNKVFWQAISDQEKSHANMIEFLQAKAEGGQIAVNEQRFSPEVMKFLAEKAAQALDEAKDENFSHERALKTALEMEKSLVEKRYFELFRVEDEELKKIVDKLEKETKQHIAKMEQELAKETSFSELLNKDGSGTIELPRSRK